MDGKENSIIKKKSQKLAFKIHNIFPDEGGVDKYKLLITTTGLFSASGKDASMYITNIIQKYMITSDIIITDATGNIGSDTIRFGLNFREVNTIEIDDINYEALQHNISVYGLKNVNLIKGDSLVHLNYTNQDVIYIDAPWGGPSYKDVERVKLYLGDIEISEIYNKFKYKAKLFVFKVPKNYDINNFLMKTLTEMIKIYNYRGIFFIITVRIKS
jgi:hypothetical protein